MGIEERNAKRVPVELPAVLEWLGCPHPVTVLDISVGGALVHCPACELPEPGNPMRLSLILTPGGPALHLLSRLVRALPEEQAALVFEIVDGASDRKLARFVQDQERIQVHVRNHLVD